MQVDNRVQAAAVAYGNTRAANSLEDRTVQNDAMPGL